SRHSALARRLRLRRRRSPSIPRASTPPSFVLPHPGERILRHRRSPSIARAGSPPSLVLLLPPHPSSFPSLSLALYPRRPFSRTCVNPSFCSRNLP
ncbi:Os03g0718300, partial [Oryza sativa Japonica Group]